MRRTSSQFLSTVILGGFVATGACAARTPREPDGYAKVASVDTVAARLVELELQRISLLAGAATDTVSRRTVDAQIAAFRERLRALPNHDLAERVVADRLLAALETRESTVASQLQTMRAAYTDEYPTVRQALVEERLLKQRKADLKAGR